MIQALIGFLSKGEEERNKFLFLKFVVHFFVGLTDNLFQGGQ